MADPQAALGDSDGRPVCRRGGSRSDQRRHRGFGLSLKRERAQGWLKEAGRSTGAAWGPQAWKLLRRLGHPPRPGKRGLASRCYGPWRLWFWSRLLASSTIIPRVAAFNEAAATPH